MTKDIKWGEAIEVSGRPDWLGDDEKCLPRWSGHWYRDESGSFVDCVSGWDTVTAIKLPADHAYYAVQRYNAARGASFVYWPGGDEAPGDWDGGDFLMRNGEELIVAEWTKPIWRHDPKKETEHDIIGYTPKPQLVTEEASEPLQSAESRNAPVNHAYESRMAERRIENDPPPEQFTPCERTVRMCIDALPEASDAIFSVLEYAKAVHSAIEAIPPKPDRAEELVEALVEAFDNASEQDAHSLAEFMSSSQAELVTKYTRWLIERGEIK